MITKKFNGTGQVFILAKHPTTILGVTYETNDVIACLNDVNMFLGYSGLQKSSTNGSGTVAASSHYNPLTFSLTEVKNQKELNKFFYSDFREEKQLLVKLQKEENAEGTIYLKTTSSPLKVRAFSDGKLIDGIFDKDNATFTVSEKYKSLDLFIYTQENSELFNLRKPDFGYFSILGIVKGKLGEKSGKIALNIPTVELVTDPAFDLSEDTYTANLAFAVVNNGREEPTIAFIDG